MDQLAPDQMAAGTVTLVGGGPGHPDLITVAGLKAIRQADIILYDRLAPIELLAEAPDAEHIPVGKVPRGEYVPQERINQLLVEHAKAGKRVVRLKGGDSFVFGRGGEEVQYCAAAGVPVQVIPGITSAVAVPALAGLAVTHRHLVQGFTVVSGHVAPADDRSLINWAALAQSDTTLVILMGVAQLRSIMAELMAAGLPRSTPVAVIADGSLPTQEVVAGSIANIADLVEQADIQPPALTVVGQTVGLDLFHTTAENLKPCDH